MKISIITTVYKAENDLPRLLDSMMAQKSPELEFFLVDNGSPDRCGEICREYAKKDKRFVVYTIKDNIGYIRARNVGMKACNADYIGFCDSDDYLEPGAYDKAVEIIKKTECDLYITAYQTHYTNGTVQNFLPYEKGLYKGNDVKEKILPQAFGPIEGKGQLHGFAWKQIFKQNLILSNNFQFMVELQPYEDQIFNIDFIRASNRVYIDDNIIYNYIVNEQSITAKIKTNFDVEKEWRRIYLLYQEKLKRAQDSVQIEALSNQALMSIYSLIISMGKKKNCSILFCANKFKKITDGKILNEVVSQASCNNSKSINFIKYCLKKKRYKLLFTVVKSAVKIRGKSQ